MNLQKTNFSTENECEFWHFSTTEMQEVSMKTAYIYARYSSDNQREESISAQIRAIHEYCDMNNIRILQEFKDEAFSARTDKRPAFRNCSV